MSSFCCKGGKKGAGRFISQFRPTGQALQKNTPRSPTIELNPHFLIPPVFASVSASVERLFFPYLCSRTVFPCPVGSAAANTRRFLCEWLSFQCRYVPVGILESPRPGHVWRIYGSRYSPPPSLPRMLALCYTHRVGCMKSWPYRKAIHFLDCCKSARTRGGGNLQLVAICSEGWIQRVKGRREHSMWCRFRWGC